MLFLTILKINFSDIINYYKTLKNKKKLEFFLILFFLRLISHNDLPWNIRKFLKNQLKDFHFGGDLRQIQPWANSAWSHTDLRRLKEGMVSAQVFIFV